MGKGDDSRELMLGSDSRHRIMLEISCLFIFGVTDEACNSVLASE